MKESDRMQEVKKEDYKIRPAVVEDVEQMYHIERDAFFDGWSKQAFIDEILINHKTEGYVLEIDGFIRGYYFAWHIAGESSLNNIAIEKSSQGKGYANLLMRHFLKRAKEKQTEASFLEVSVANTRAIVLYEKFGFTIVGKRDNYYEKAHEDAYIMRRLEGEIMCII